MIGIATPDACKELDPSISQSVDENTSYGAIIKSLCHRLAVFEIIYLKGYTEETK